MKKIFETTEANNIPGLQPSLVVELLSSQPCFIQDDQKIKYNIQKKRLPPLAYQQNFLQEIGCKTDRPICIYSKLICKPDFIIHHINECTIVSLEMLIADQKTLFSPQFSVYEYYHYFFRKWCVPQPQKNHAFIHCCCSSSALCQVKKDGNRTLFERILSRFSPATKNDLEQFLELAKNLVTYWKKLPDGDEACFLLKKAKDLLINAKLDDLGDLSAITKLTEGTIISFVSECLPEYLRAYNDTMLINKDPMTGHYNEKANIDYDSALRYSIRCKIFENIRSDLAYLWSNLEYPFKAEESFNIISIPGGRSTFTATTFEQVQKNIYQYFTDDTQEKLSSSQIKFIIPKLEQEYKELFPFRALVLCIVKGGTFFKRPYKREMKEILDFPNHIYRAKPSVADQRVKRLRLLFALCQTCELTKNDIEQNILLFLKYHGVVPQSEEEFVLWYDFLQKYIYGLSYQSPSSIRKCIKKLLSVAI